MAKYYSKRKEKSSLSWSLIDRWPLNSGLVDAFHDLVQRELDKLPVEVVNKTVILFSAHSLPMQVSL